MPVLMPAPEWRGLPVAPTVETVSPATVTVGGVTFGSRDSDGVEWVFDSLEGWYEPPQMTVGAQPRPNAHGSITQRGRRAGRVVALSGWVSAPTRALMANAVVRLSSILGDGESGDLTVDDEDMGALTVTAQMAPTEPVIQWDHPQLATYVLEFFCPDPLRYGTQVSLSTGLPQLVGGLEYDLYTDGTTDVGYLDYGPAGTSGKVTLSNTGTAEARPSFVITGTLPDGFELAETYTGRRLRYEGPIAASPGDPVFLDAATGRVRLGSADRRGLLTRAEWWGVPPGGVREVLFSSLGSYSADAQMTATFRPAFW